MTKTELFKEAEEWYDKSENYQLNHCTAWYTNPRQFSDGKVYQVLTSYRTIVAVYCHDINCTFVRDYYSATTVQHIYKFHRKMEARHGESSMVFLYHRNDGIIIRFPYPTRPLKFTKVFHDLYLLPLDYSTLIDGSWNDYSKPNFTHEI